MISRRGLFAFALLAFALMQALPAQFAGQENGFGEAIVDTVGARDFFYCALFQTIQVAGLITANVGLVVAGAIGGGLACGFAL